MPHRRRFGISCPTCDSPSRVIDTVRRPDGMIRRVRQCHDADHLFSTDETPYRCTPDCDWTRDSLVLNSRNLVDRIQRERLCRGGAPFKTIERIRG